MDYIGQILASMPPGTDRKKLLQMMDQTMAHYRSQIHHHMKGAEEERNGVVVAMTELVDESLRKMEDDKKKLMKCGKGCASCCKIQVHVSLAEAQYILALCKDNGITIDVEYLKQQASIKESWAYVKSPVSRCVFLDETDSCKIYEHRPIVCRKYMVASDPRMCDTRLGRKDVAIIATIEEDLMHLALCSSDSHSGSLSEMLLQAIALQQNQEG